MQCHQTCTSPGCQASSSGRQANTSGRQATASLLEHCGESGCVGGVGVVKEARAVLQVIGVVSDVLRRVEYRVLDDEQDGCDGCHGNAAFEDEFGVLADVRHADMLVVKQLSQFTKVKYKFFII